MIFGFFLSVGFFVIIGFPTDWFVGGIMGLECLVIALRGGNQ
jgi:hypothetical protein